VSATNALYEIEPRTGAVRNTISLNGLPGKLAFTPNGVAAVAANSVAATGASAFYIDLARRTVTPIAYSGFLLDDVVVPDNTTAYGYSRDTGGLYIMPLAGAGTITQANVGGTTLQGVTDIATSLEAPARYLFVTTSSGVYRVVLQSNQLTGPVTAQVMDSISLAGPTTNSGISNYIQINNNQTVAAGQTSLPLVVRAIDSVGNPVPGVTSTFTTSSSATISGASSSTNELGYALAYVNIPAGSASGAITVNVTLGTLQIPFIINVGGTGGGGGPEQPTGGLEIYRGQGQVIPRTFPPPPPSL
jgi:hypothetical protein